MSDRPSDLEIPVPAMGLGGMFHVTRSEFGDYCDFALVGAGDLVVLLPGYAARLSVESVSSAIEGGLVGYTLLIVGSTCVYLPLESGQLLADFLGVPLETKQKTGESR